MPSFAGQWHARLNFCKDDHPRTLWYSIPGDSHLRSQITGEALFSALTNEWSTVMPQVLALEVKLCHTNEYMNPTLSRRCLTDSARVIDILVDNRPGNVYVSRRRLSASTGRYTCRKIMSASRTSSKKSLNNYQSNYCEMGSLRAASYRPSRTWGSFWSLSRSLGGDPTGSLIRYPYCLFG